MGTWREDDLYDLLKPFVGRGEEDPARVSRSRTDLEGDFLEGDEGGGLVDCIYSLRLFWASVVLLFFFVEFLVKSPM